MGLWIAPFARSWEWIVVRGVAAIIFGLFAIIHPLLTFDGLLMLFAIYLIIDGLATIVSGLQEQQPGLMWLGDGILGVLLGVTCLFVPLTATVAIVYLWAAWALVTGALEVVAGLRLQREYQHGWFLTVAGLVSICLGLVFLLQPLAIVVGLTWCLAVYALAFGGSMLWLAAHLRDVDLAPIRPEEPRVKSWIQPTIEEQETPVQHR